MYSNNFVFPLNMPVHIIFCCIGALFFGLQYYRKRQHHQLLLALAIPSTLLVYTCYSDLSLLLLGMEQILLYIIIVISMIISRRKVKLSPIVSEDTTGGGMAVSTASVPVDPLTKSDIPETHTNTIPVTDEPANKIVTSNRSSPIKKSDELKSNMRANDLLRELDNAKFSHSAGRNVNINKTKAEQLLEELDAAKSELSTADFKRKDDIQQQTKQKSEEQTKSRTKSDIKDKPFTLDVDILTKVINKSDNPESQNEKMSLDDLLEELKKDENSNS